MAYKRIILLLGLFLLRIQCCLAEFKDEIVPQVNAVNFIQNADKFKENLPTNALDVSIYQKPIQQSFAYLVNANIAIKNKGADSIIINQFKQSINALADDYSAINALAYVHFELGKFYYDHQNPAAAAENILYSQALLNNQINDVIIDLSEYYLYLGRIYSDFSDYKDGKKYLQLSLHYPTQNKWLRYYEYGTLGFIYYKVELADSSIWASKQALAVVQDLKDTIQMGSISGNIGAAYFLKGNYTEALEWLNKDLSISLAHNNEQSIVAGLIFQSKVFLKINNSAKAFELLNQIPNYHHLFGNLPANVKQEYYKNLHDYYKQIGQFDKADKAQDSSNYYLTVMTNNFNESIVKSLELKGISQLNESKLKALQLEKKRALLWRNSLIVGITLVLIISLQQLYIYRKRASQKQQILQMKLATAEQLLNNYLNNIKAKNLLIEELEGHIASNNEIASQIEMKPSNKEEATLGVIKKLQSDTILTEEGWQNFLQIFENVYPDFYWKLRQNYPQLTAGELRLLVLTKLNLSTKEMSSILGIAVDSVRKSKQRLKKKLDNETELSIEEFVNEI